MNEVQADYIVIGSGPAGQKAAIQAAKLGKTVIVIEKGAHLEARRSTRARFRQNL